VFDVLTKYDANAIDVSHAELTNAMRLIRHV